MDNSSQPSSSGRVDISNVKNAEISSSASINIFKNCLPDS